MRHTIQQEIKGVIAFMAIIWGVFLLECVSPIDLTSYGLIPRTLTGVIGIPSMPFLHASVQHIAATRSRCLCCSSCWRGRELDRGKSSLELS